MLILCATCHAMLQADTSQTLKKTVKLTDRGSTALAGANSME